jgi:hypothetical protein
VPKVTDKVLLQVVYLNGKGFKLLKWPLSEFIIPR